MMKLNLNSYLAFVKLFLYIYIYFVIFLFLDQKSNDRNSSYLNANSIF